MVEDKKVISPDNTARVKDLLVCMENDDEQGAKEIIDDLTGIREGTLYQEMGKLTRELHDAISNFGVDDRIAELAENKIPDARDRLNYVISKTDEAANRTLEAIEESIPICDKVVEEASDLHGYWQKFMSRDLSADQFRKLSRDLDKFLEEASDVEKVKGHLTSVLLAQEYQDLTGQIIKKVINMVGEVESNLVELIKLTGMPQKKAADDKDKDSLDGPPVPGLAHEDTVSGQDEVDDLLSSLGF